MKEYEILKHTADLKIRAFGKTKEELFLNTLKGMISGLRPEILNSKAEIRDIEIKSPNLESLLVDFLNEVLYLIQINKEIYTDIKIKRMTDMKIKGKLIGQKIERLGEEIKAVTYHQLKIEEINKTWEATVLFDI